MKKIFAIITLLGIGTSMMAQSLEFLNVGSSAAGWGVAGATVASDADAFAMEANVASMALTEQSMNAAVSYGMWSPSAVKTNNLGLGGFYRYKNMAFGLVGKYNLHGAYDVINEVGKPMDSYTPSDLAVGLGFAYSVLDMVSFGLNVKFANQSLAPAVSGTGIGVDLGVMFRMNGLRTGVSVNNIGPAVKYGSTSYSMPMSIKAGASYGVKGLNVSAELDYFMKAGLAAALGAEYWIADIVAVRGGFHYGDAEKVTPTYGSLGLGLKLFGARLDAAYLLSSPGVGNSLMVGLGYSF